MKARCPNCHGAYSVNKDGSIRKHPCQGSRSSEVSDPAPTVDTMDDECEHPNGFTEHGCPCGASAPDDDREETDTPGRSPLLDETKGPWFGALYIGACSNLGCRIDEGDRIRADGQGGYECEDCGEAPDRLIAVTKIRDNPYAAVPDQPVREVTSLDLPDPGPMGDTSLLGPTPTADEFMFEDPTASEGPADELNVSGQPKARYEWRGSVNMGYLVTDPATGDFNRYKNRKPKGFTRATTFNKAASDSKAINDWGKRNIVIGAARRRDVLLRAHGLTHEDRAELMSIVAELEEAAGAKVGSDLGTYLHTFTELMDAGLKTWRDAPEEFQRSLALYSQALADAGLEPVPGLIERTTMIREFGGVVGTFDRVFYHRPSGTYLIGDLKTGKTMEYAMDETETQMWTYAHGVNQNGIYDWNTDRWGAALNKFGEPVAVSETVGVIIHMPVQGPQEGTVSLLKADLVAGARHAELCHAIRSRAKSKVRPFELPAAPQPTPELNNPTSDDVWRALFRGARTQEGATALWRRAKEDGLQGIFLNELIEIGREAIRENA